jgi:hypothetical protein
MSRPTDTLRVVIPLTIRRRNGRPRVLPPEDLAARQARAQDPHILRALGRAWAWRRMLESGEKATVGDIAKAERVTDRFVSRTMRLAYLSPEVLEQMVISRDPRSVSVNELIEVTYLPWVKQTERVFDGRPSTRAWATN